MSIFLRAEGGNSGSDDFAPSQFQRTSSSFSVSPWLSEEVCSERGPARAVRLKLFSVVESVFVGIDSGALGGIVWRLGKPFVDFLDWCFLVDSSATC